jgi:hypothetical protein
MVARLDEYSKGSLMGNEQGFDELAELTSLQKVLIWSLGRSPRAEFVDVVVQDEYHHDVIVRIADRVFTVFEAS